MDLKKQALATVQGIYNEIISNPIAVSLSVGSGVSYWLGVNHYKQQAFKANIEGLLNFVNQVIYACDPVKATNLDLLILNGMFNKVYKQNMPDELVVVCNEVIKPFHLSSSREVLGYGIKLFKDKSLSETQKILGELLKFGPYKLIEPIDIDFKRYCDEKICVLYRDTVSALSEARFADKISNHPLVAVCIAGGMYSAYKINQKVDEVGGYGTLLNQTYGTLLSARNRFFGTVNQADEVNEIKASLDEIKALKASLDEIKTSLDEIKALLSARNRFFGTVNQADEVNEIKASLDEIETSIKTSLDENKALLEALGSVDIPSGDRELGGSVDSPSGDSGADL